MQQVLTKGVISTYDYKNLALLSKPQIFELLEFLTERISKQFIMMGGLLHIIRINKWYEPHPTFMDFCDTLVGIEYRKAMNLIDIYKHLVENHIPFEEVSAMGLSKMLYLAPHLTESNYKELIAWAKTLNTTQIKEELKLAAMKSKEFLAKFKTSEDLQPDHKDTIKIIKPEVSVLKHLITITPISTVLQALKMLYPDKDFSLG